MFHCVFNSVQLCDPNVLVSKFKFPDTNVDEEIISEGLIGCHEGAVAIPLEPTELKNFLEVEVSAGRKLVVFELFWYGICPKLPPAIFVAEVALPDKFPIIFELNVLLPANV